MRGFTVLCQWKPEMEISNEKVSQIIWNINNEHDTDAFASRKLLLWEFWIFALLCFRADGSTIATEYHYMFDLNFWRCKIFNKRRVLSNIDLMKRLLCVYKLATKKFGYAVLTCIESSSCRVLINGRDKWNVRNVHPHVCNRIFKLLN